ncbi:MAG TPA: hypothetical protein VHE55_07080 [Fimbriimonadaceae bacterium]|nr:hypothetical protein [Fimbriimonadaceae bacterium]
MKLLVLLLALLRTQGPTQDPQPPTDPNLLQFQSLLLGMKFNYPKTWELTTNKKNETRILIPMENTSDRAVVEVYSVSFRSEPEIWQLSEAAFAKTMKRKVERQWEEEILDVPLLLTKVDFTDKGSRKVSETGLLYTLGFNKLMYRITAAPENFDKADYEWRKVLQTLRTWTGEMPKKEDGSKIERKDPIPAGEKPDDVPHPTIPHEINAQPKEKAVKSPPVATVVSGDSKKLLLCAPNGWKADVNKDNSVTLTHPGVNGPISITVFPVAGSDPSDLALLKSSGTALNDYVKVTTRDESLPKANVAGASVASIWRTGTDGKGNLFTCEASCQSGDFYLLLSFRTSDAAHWKQDRHEIEELLDHLSIEPAP